MGKFSARKIAAGEGVTLSINRQKKAQYLQERSGNISNPDPRLQPHRRLVDAGVPGTQGSDVVEEVTSGLVGGGARV
jgi:hypothetical protein